MADLIGKTIDKYRIVARIGGGGMGDVYRATHLGFDEMVAVKALKENLVHDEELVARFVREAKICRSLEHPRIVRVSDVSLEQTRPPYMVMKLLEGEDLGKRLKNGMLTQEKTIAIISQVLEGLAFAHARNIIHRDIKAGNIFRLTDGSIQVMDFGLAKVIGDTQMTSTGHVMGTFTYMSPEQTRGGELDARSDLYSVGVLLYYMLSGDLPFRASDFNGYYHKHNSEAPPPLPDFIPKHLRDLVAKALEKKMENRFQSADEMRKALALAIPKPVRLQNSPAQQWIPPQSQADPVQRIPIIVQNPAGQPRRTPVSSHSGGKRIIQVAIAAIVIGVLYGGWNGFIAPSLAKLAPIPKSSSQLPDKPPKSKTIAVPPLIGKSEDEAKNDLQKKSLKLIVSDHQFSKLVEKGIIISQKPNSGKIKANSNIDVVISKGTKPSPPPVDEWITYTSTKYGLSVKHPSDWRVSYSSTNPGTQITFQSPTKNVYFFTEIGPGNPTISPLSDWQQNDIKYQNKFGTRYSKISIQSDKLGGLDAATWEFNLQKPHEQNLRKREIGLDHNGSGYALVFVAPTDTFDTNESTFSKIRESFHFIGEEIEAPPSPSSTQIQNGDDELFEMVRTKKLKEEDLSSLSEDSIGLMRNSLFARYGLIFKTREDLNRYFRQKSWYAPDTNDMGIVFDRFSDTEKHNSRFLVKHQQQSGSLKIKSN